MMLLLVRYVEIPFDEIDVMLTAIVVVKFYEA
jgi:hypothetical protein